MWLEDRAKIVRPDFLCGSSDASGNVRHWTKNQIVINKLKNFLIKI
jgi:hypothetical protein